MNPEDTKALILGIVQYLNASPHLFKGSWFFPTQFMGQILQLCLCVEGGTRDNQSSGATQVYTEGATLSQELKESNDGLTAQLGHWSVFYRKLSGSCKGNAFVDTRAKSILLMPPPK